jgi:hypothetical protein
LKTKEVEALNVPRWITASALCLLLVATTIALLAFTTAWTPAPRCFTDIAHSQFPKWLGCAIATHETLAGSLIAAGGALFAAWLAFVGLQDQIGLARKNEREAKRLAIEKKIQDAAADWGLVGIASGYVNALAEEFPPSNLGPDPHREIFASRLVALRGRGDLRLNVNAARAPDGIGETVTTLVGRLNTLADNLYEETKNLSADMRAPKLRSREPEVVGLIEALRRLDKELQEQADVYAQKYKDARAESMEYDCA